MQIDKNIPLAKAKLGRKTSTPYMNEMEVGDSVLFEDRVIANRLRSNMQNIGMLPAIRKVEDGFRVWKMK